MLAIPRNLNARRRHLSGVSGSDGAALAVTPASRLPKVRQLPADRMTMAAEVAIASASLEEADAFDPFVGHYDHAFRFAYLVSGDRQAAEDAVQTAFVHLLARPRMPPDNVAAYVRKTVVNALLAERRSATRRAAREQRFVSGASQTCDNRSADADVAAALTALTARQRAAVVLRYWEDLSERDIAAALGCRPGTVKSLLARSLEILRETVPHD